MKASKPPILLASTSIYRKQLLSRLGLTFETAAPKTDETARDNEQPTDLVCRLAQEKASSLARQFPHHVIIGSDQVAELGGKILGKPHSFAAASAQLKAQSGRTTFFHTGLCVLPPGGNPALLDRVSVAVTFRALTAVEIERYLAAERPLDCAGSIKCEGLGISLISAIDGYDTTALIGLPLIKLCEYLRSCGVEVP